MFFPKTSFQFDVWHKKSSFTIINNNKEEKYLWGKTLCYNIRGLGKTKKKTEF
jgi:hypothetical protein